ncbi:molybdopterin-synthase adenylyltransferase MoeB [Microbulbifer sp. 2205BS26-8]|uniref:molybdopterin-synthase adenylyltransferase MoeB n=1 Tax=Microbulbifer sp. 2205BS26-8 TaxID=3064386 RepID=UPI00273F77FC|nr:molybdopterin-synthase adenylyltransferase MoeB [Microbulbifer sp. 2205BS26-8]MDP5210671.1 molybdopterin-synthase adenylyltransferase MoeB [Microbulbifer sp. 2205BS26-8]
MSTNDFFKKIQTSVKEITPEAALKLVSDDTSKLFDIREDREIESGTAQGAKHIARAFLELRISQYAQPKDTIILMCASGKRSLIAAHQLQELGYRDVASLAGGFDAWKASDLPSCQPRILASHEQSRYARHLLMPEVGLEGQLKLRDSRVLIVGAGGLGSPVALYLAAAGVGTLAMIDDDKVELSNLQRQVMYTEDDLDSAKAQASRHRLQEMNTDIDVIAIENRLNRDNVESIFEGYDVVIDGTDNFNTRYLIADACTKLKIPNIHGSVYRFEGLVSVFAPDVNPSTPCYRCLYPEPPPPELAPSCSEAGVLGVVPGVIGCLMATETVKWLLGIGVPLLGHVLSINALNMTFKKLPIEANMECRWCKSSTEKYPDYAEIQPIACAL